jgi:2,3-bisphosphoglycerate-independent phosphoglycerate mutase
MTMRPRPLALIILDGFGHREQQEANAIAHANKPYWDFLWQNYPHSLISGSGRCVGLPDGQMGNSEVGHLNMGSGRIVHQDLTQIDAAISSGEFFHNPVLTEAIQQTIINGKALHVMGLLSPGGVHSHENHFLALLQLTQQLGATKVYLHAFLDGRDTPPRSANNSLARITQYCKDYNNGQIVSIIGRYYAMDRDQRWDRVESAYNLLAHGKAKFHAENALAGLAMAYDRGENDEFVSATAIHPNNQAPIQIEDGDSIIFMNFRADRAREISRAFIESQFNCFPRMSRPQLNEFVTLTEYDEKFHAKVAFPPLRLTQILGEYLSQLGLRQLRIAETEKYAHVTFFFNGGIETPFPGEDRILIPSPKVATYDLKPEMSAPELTKQLVTAIKEKKYDVIICNFANPDMVGHTGNFAATVKAIETIDFCLKDLITALQETGGEAIITADHGNAEMMFDQCTGQAHTAHTSELVPFIYIGRAAEIIKTDGILSDIAPTMLYLMNLPIPNEMTGHPLLKLL